MVNWEEEEVLEEVSPLEIPSVVKEEASKEAIMVASRAVFSS